MKDHYSWRDSFELTENQANRMKLSQQRQKQNAGRAQQQMGAIKSAVGGAAKAVGGAVGGAVKAVGSALKPKPMVRKPGQTSVRTRGGGAPQVAKPKPQPKPAPQATPVQTRQPAPQASPAPQAKPAAPAPKMGRTEVANRQKFGDARVDALKAKNQEFQAAKKSGNLAQFRKDNPKMSGRERAQAMAKARIAAKNAPASKPTANTVTKPAPQQAQAKPTANTVSKPESSVPTGSFGISAKGKEQAAANRKEVAVKNNQSGSGVKKPVSPEMQRRLNRMNVGKNAADEVNFAYDYNEDGYPRQVIVTEGSYSSTVDVSYY